jgi:hypothetical protein
MQTDERDETDTPADENMGPSTQTGDAIDAFGTLSISEHGISRFFGPTGGSEVISLYLDLYSWPHTSYLHFIEFAFGKSISPSNARFQVLNLLIVKSRPELS